MPREKNYKAIILKKMPFGEADEIVSFYTEETGKVRALAKSIKFSKSKLQYSLQSLFLVKISLAGSGLAKIIGVEVLRTFSKLRENLEAAKMTYYAAELVLKFTPDEQPNESVFHLLVEFLEFLDLASSGPAQLLPLALAKFKISLLEALGLAVNYPSNAAGASEVGFSNSRGSFLSAEDAIDFRPLSPHTFRQFLELKEISFDQLLRIKLPESLGNGNISELQDLLSSFLVYQLERDIKSEKYLEL